MFTVEGYEPGTMVSYVVQVGGDLSGADPSTADGICRGNVRAIGTLVAHEGLPVDVTPTGPTVTGSTSTPDGALAILLAHTQVTRVTGDDVPALYTRGPAGAVY